MTIADIPVGLKLQRHVCANPDADGSFPDRQRGRLGRANGFTHDRRARFRRDIINHRYGTANRAERGTGSGCDHGAVKPGTRYTSSRPVQALTDAGTPDTHTALWSWGDAASSAGTVTQGTGSGSVSNLHTYTMTGESTR